MLHRTWQFIGKPFVFWLLAFALYKFFFLLYHSASFSGVVFSEVIKSFFIPFRLDIAAATYILIIPILLWLIQIFTSRLFFDKFSIVYHTFFILLVSVINIVDIELYKHWQTKLNVKALMFLNEPGMVANAAGPQESIFLILFVLFVTLLLFRFFQYFCNAKLGSFNRNWRTQLLLIILLPALIVVGVRGGFQVVPVNQSDAYYHKNPTLNYAGVNSLWNLGNSFFQNRQSLHTNQYRVMNEETAHHIVSDLYTVAIDSTTPLFNVEKPNIVYVAFEGINANVIKEYQGGYNHMPNLSAIIEESITFTNVYASGQRTDQGLVSLLSGFPSLPLNTIGAQPEKFAQLPSLPLQLQNEGYNCSFYFGGEPEFGSFKSYLVHNGFEPIIDIHSFGKEQRIQKLGAPDEYLFNYFREDMSQAKEPFFSLILTQTTHEPFDMPFNESVSSQKQKYLNTVAYTDSVVGDWWLKIQEEAWFDNTIFVFSSDHAHPQPNEYWYSDRNRYRIPFIIAGTPLKETYRGVLIDGYFSQTDIPKTILNQLNIESNDFFWSKDMMNPYSPEFAFYIFIEGFSYVTPDYSCGWEYRYQKPENLVSNNETATSNCETLGKAYMQEIYEQYRNY